MFSFFFKAYEPPFNNFVLLCVRYCRDLSYTLFAVCLSSWMFKQNYLT